MVAFDPQARDHGIGIGTGAGLAAALHEGAEASYFPAGRRVKSREQVNMVDGMRLDWRSPEYGGPLVGRHGVTATDLFHLRALAEDFGGGTGIEIDPCGVRCIMTSPGPCGTEERERREGE